MIKNIVFDIGNVLLSFKPQQFLESFINEEQIVCEVLEEVFKSEEWLMLDRGTIDEEEAIKRICSRAAKNETYIRAAIFEWQKILEPITEVTALLPTLKEKGYKLYYLSNFHRTAFKKVFLENEFFKIFDGGVVSFEEGLLKPESEIYDILLHRYELVPEETVFIDDTLENIKAAEMIAIQTIHFNSVEDIKSLIE